MMHLPTWPMVAGAVFLGIILGFAWTVWDKARARRADYKRRMEKP